MGRLQHKPTPPKKSDNPRYIGTGRKPDIKMGVEQYKVGWMPKEEYWKMRKQQDAIKAGIKPTEEQLAHLTHLTSLGNKVAEQIAEWYSLHGVITSSQLA